MSRRERIVRDFTCLTEMSCQVNKSAGKPLCSRFRVEEAVYCKGNPNPDVAPQIAGFCLMRHDTVAGVISQRPSGLWGAAGGSAGTVRPDVDGELSERDPEAEIESQGQNRDNRPGEQRQRSLDRIVDEKSVRTEF